LSTRHKVPAKSIVVSVFACLVCLGSTIFAGPPILGGALPTPLPLFPADNWWNLDISDAPVDPGSSSFIAFINSPGAKRLHPDLGGNESPGSVEIYGFPYIVVDGNQPKVAVNFYYSDESDGVDSTGKSIPFYPIPDEAKTQAHWIEGGQPGNVDLRNQADRHMLIVDRDNRLLYELYNVYYDGTRWNAGSGAFFDLKTNNRRPETWTSADAAGLAILPGLIRYDEVFGPDEIRHAFRFTVRDTNGYVYPASHRAGSNPKALPMGARLRLKASVDISGYLPEIQKIFRAMKKYGLIVADNGSDMYISGTYDTRWNNDLLNPAFSSLAANDFEVVRLGYQPSQITYFPHLAVGSGYTTVFSLVNTGAATASGDLFLYDGSGKPLGIALSEGTSPYDSQPGSAAATGGSTVPVTLKPGATMMLTANLPDPSSPTKSGWARLETGGGSVSGVATFQFAEGNILRTIAGVFAAAPVETVTIPVDNDDDQDRFTGFAVANPNDVAINIRLATLDAEGALRDQLQPPGLTPLAAHGQVASYLHQYLSSTRKFRGSLKLTADGGSKFVVVALQQSKSLFTAIPVIPGR
jgi:hypothetical protein